MTIDRDLAPQLRKAAAGLPAITLTGPRQSGKTTLCRALFPQHACLSLEEPDTRAFAIEDPRAFLSQVADGCILDEAQQRADGTLIPWNRLHEADL